MIRCLIGVLLLCSTSAAFADPILLLLLRMVRDKAVSASIEASVDNLRQPNKTMPSPTYGFALPFRAATKSSYCARSWMTIFCI